MSAGAVFAAFTRKMAKRRMPSKKRSRFWARRAASGLTAMSLSAFSHLPVVAAEAICSGATAINLRPFSVETMLLPARSASPTSMSRSMVAARVAGVPRPEDFMRSRSSSSSSSCPACSIRESSEASLSLSGGLVCFLRALTFPAVRTSPSRTSGRGVAAFFSTGASTARQPMSTGTAPSARNSWPLTTTRRRADS